MAALNIAETQTLSDAQKIIQIVLREGYDPNGTDIKNLRIKKDLEAAKSGLNVVRQMKGHYFN